MKIDWGFMGVLVTFLVVSVGWGVSVEVRMAQQASLKSIQESVVTLVSRTENIEKLLLPVIVDYKVRKEVEEKMAKMMPFPTLPAPNSHVKEPRINPNPVSGGAAPPLNVQQTPEMIKEAHKWATERIREGQQPRNQQE